MNKYSQAEYVCTSGGKFTSDIHCLFVFAYYGVMYWISTEITVCWKAVSKPGT